MKKEHPFLPIIILTSLNTKKSFIKGIKLGVNDYILKPFDDNTLISRIKKNISHSKNITATERTIDFNSYLNIELIKASKGKYSLSIGLFTFYNKIQANQSNLEEYYDAQNTIYKKFQKLFFETDFFTPYSSKYFLVVLPFCKYENVKIVRSKIIEYGDSLLNELGMTSYGISTAFVTSPNDGIKKTDLLDKLTSQINNNMNP